MAARFIERASLIALLAITAARCAEAAPAAADPAKTRTYIERAWSTLTRSMQDCAALTDPKVDAHPVLYIPAQLPVPAELREVSKRCQVSVRSLPQVIRQLGDVDPTRLPVQGLLYLPNAYGCLPISAARWRATWSTTHCSRWSTTAGC